jgi:hypothetical protein
MQNVQGTIKAHFSKNCRFGLKRRHLFFAVFFLRFENLAAELNKFACVTASNK